MSIDKFFTTLFVVRRSAWTTDESGNPFSENQEVGNFMGHIQQATPELAQSLGLALTKSFTVWCGVSEDVREGDIIESEEGIFSIRAVQKNGIGANAHKQLVAQLDQVNGS